MRIIITYTETDKEKCIKFYLFFEINCTKLWNIYFEKTFHSKNYKIRILVLYLVKKKEKRIKQLIN